MVDCGPSAFGGSSLVYGRSFNCASLCPERDISCVPASLILGKRREPSLVDRGADHERRLGILCLRKAQPIAKRRIADRIGSSVSEARMLIAGADALLVSHANEGAFGKHPQEGRCRTSAATNLPILASLGPAMLIRPESGM